MAEIERRAGSVLVVDDEENILAAARQALERSGYTVETAPSGEEALARVNARDFDVALCDIRLPGLDGIDLLARLRERAARTVVLMITAFASIESAVRCIKLGAFDYIPKPFTPKQLRDAVKRAMEVRRTAEHGGAGDADPRALGPRVAFGPSEKMRQLFARASRIADVSSPVLVTGERGTGKEVLARYMHARSRRASGPFVTMPCAIVTAADLDASAPGEARSTRPSYLLPPGVFAAARGGTLFLDDVSRLSPEAQAKFLHALEVHEAGRPLGAGAPEVRIIASSARDLHAEARAGRFRADLFYRLAVIDLVVPPLRERKEDIAPLARSFLALAAEQLGKGRLELASEAQAFLEAYPWPGNVRELRSAIEYAAIFAPQRGFIGRREIATFFAEERAVELDEISRAGVPSRRPDESVTDHIRRVLAACAGNVVQAARFLGIPAEAIARSVADSHR